ncbi:MAG: pitrilysin family protein [Bacteroidota bacterium]
MRKTVLTILSCFTLLFAIGQIDRSKQPEPGPAPKINLGDPNTFEMNNGLKVMVVENNKLPRVRIQLRLDNPPVLEGENAGVSSLMASMLGNGSTNIPKDDFNEEVDFLGATISFGSGNAFASCLSKYFPRILELMADAAINPNFTEEEFEKEKSKLITNLKAQEKDVSAISTRVQLALGYGKNNPNGEFTTEETVNNVALTDVQQFYRKNFVPANAYLIIVGDVEFDSVKELVTAAFTPWTRAVPPSFEYSTPQDAQYTQINFVDAPNAVQSEVSVQNLIELTMKDDDYLSALIANQILGGGGEGRLFLNLREDKGYTYGSYSGIRDNKYGPTRFNAFAEVRNEVADSAVVEILKEIDRMRNEPVSEKELATTKAKYSGRFVMALERPETVANYAYNIETEDLPKDFYKTYLERIDAISIDQVQQAAQKYFSIDNARVVVVGKGSEVLENLEKVSFNNKAVPVLFYDKYASKTEKPNYDVAVPEGTTAATVLEKYIEAIGGKEKLESVASYAIIAEAEMQGMKLELEMKKTSKDQFMQDVKVMGNSMSKQVLDGDKGYMMMQGQRKDLSEEEITKIKEESAPFPELNYLTAGGVRLEGITPVGDKKAYALKITESKTAFYDVETGLKIQEINVQEMQGQQVQQTMQLQNYQEVSGVKFPFKLIQTMGPQNFEFIVKEIKVNEGVTPADFE